MSRTGQTGILCCRFGGQKGNSGSKPKRKFRLRGLPKVNADLILQEVSATARWIELARSQDKKLRFEVLRYLTDRSCGKPATVTSFDGQVAVKVVVDL
jgi:hypothetical protein